MADCRVLVVGAGGLGGPYAVLLAALPSSLLTQTLSSFGRSSPFTAIGFVHFLIAVDCSVGTIVAAVVASSAAAFVARACLQAASC